MNKQLSINMDIVTKYMLMAQGPIKGVSVIDIAGATGLSRSTVYRVINIHPAIEPMNTPGRKQVYRLNLDRLNDQAIAGSKGRKIEVDEAHAIYFDGLNPIQLMLKLQGYIKPDSDGNSAIRAVMQPIAKFASEAIAFQQGEGDAPLDATAFRAAVEEALLFSAMLQISLTNIKRDKNYTSNECWSVFTVEDFEKEKN